MVEPLGLRMLSCREGCCLLPISPKSDAFATSAFRQQTWREFIGMAVGTILGVLYRK